MKTERSVFAFQVRSAVLANLTLFDRPAEHCRFFIQGLEAGLRVHRTSTL